MAGGMPGEAGCVGRPTRHRRAFARLQELRQLLQENGFDDLDRVDAAFWNGGELHLASRRIISGFIKDKTLGEKRLISMPDRVTNTVQIVTRKDTGYRPPPVCRPCVIATALLLRALLRVRLRGWSPPGDRPSTLQNSLF